MTTITESLLSGLPEITLTEDGKHYVSEGKEYQRVTDVISKVLPPYLAPWAEKVGQQAAITIFRATGTLPDTQAELANQARQMGITCDDEKTNGGDRGQALHQAIEAMIRTNEPVVDLHDFDNPEHRLYAQSFAEWMLDYQPIFEEAEVRIVHPELGYAGTFDAIGKVTARPKGARGPDLTGKRLIFDFKTNVEAKVYDQHLFQLAGYHLACEHFGIPVHGSAVVAVGPKGQMKKKTPYTFKANYIQPHAFGGVIEFHRLVQSQKARNPLARKAK